MTTLNLEGISCSIGAKTLVRETSLTFRDGRINLLLGPNGAGKTSLLRLCALLDSPGTGNILVLPTQGLKSSPAINGITMVFQNPVLFNRTVKENLAYPLKVRGFSREQTQTRINEALEAADLTGLVNRNALSLSGGEAQRLALARAFAIHPSILILDEPAANLDQASKWRSEEMVLEMQDRFGTTVILTTHDLLQARKIGEIVFFMQQGRVTGPFETRDFFHSPPSEDAARFIAGVLQQDYS